MAAFSLTVTGVDISANVQSRTAGDSTIVSGRGVTPDGEYVDAADTTATARDLLGLTFHPALAGGKLQVVQSGKVYVSNTLTPGKQLIISGSSGELDYNENLVAGERYLIVGYVEAADTVVVQVSNTTHVAPNP